jgi:light-regulated signal transduction histidine kinase (bacteriophytochrome)
MVALSSGKPVTNVLMGIFHPKLNEYRWILIDSIPQFRLGETIPYQVFSTFTDMTNRTKVEEEFEQLNKTLEQRVIERTSDLESFTYSVAHDLRAPLRAIDGFSGILVEDYKALLDDTGKNVIRKIRDNVLQMDELMFGLLEFSRMGRSDMMKTEFSMATVVEECYQKLTTPESREKISFTMKGHCKVCADKAMMYHVWGNLLSNAIKFTSRCETPEITVTCNTENKMNIFRISDNGAGFDMRYKDKLFGVFQRLHSTREYSGTGVGLAIVQRIIHRHGGKIWAEAEVGKGATFYFTLDQAG